MAYPEGVDLSRYNTADYDWAAFVIVRLGSVMADDPLRSQHTDFARARKIPLGSYWFLYDSTSITPEQQAEHAFQLQRDLGLDGVPHFADCEGELSTDTAKRYIARMQQLRGDCGIYSGWWVKSRGGPTLGADYGWLPEYHDTYTLPAQWTSAFTKVWQWTSSNGTLDRDRFLGTQDEMVYFFGGDMAAVDDLLDGMTQAEAAAVANGMADPGPPPDTLSAYGKKGWNRVRWNINKVYTALSARVSSDESVLSGQAASISNLSGRVATLETKPEPTTHTHATVTVAGPAEEG